jgi:hypothetical protein
VLVESDPRLKQSERIMINFGMGPPAKGDEDQILIQVVTKDGNAENRETTWARSLGQDLYEVKGPLHLVTGVNTGDVVKARMLPDYSAPVVVEIVRRSGYSTLHIAFAREVPIADQQRVLENLQKMGATHHLVFERFYTIEIKLPEDYQVAERYLKLKVSEGLLVYEPAMDINALLRLRFTGPEYE